ncbi:MAG: BrnT family toxin [Acetobacteraceae bacterium]
MEFEWDAAKSERNREERGLPFELAVELFEGPFNERTDSRHDYGETRMQVVGRVGGSILVCVYTDRGEVRRIISLRDANRRERNASRTSFSR